jgi:signal transduction histidine kinase
MYKKINYYLNKLNFTSKTKILISITTISMMTISFFMLISIFTIKYDYETLYHKITTSQINLEKMKDIYTVNIHDTLYDIKQNAIDNNDAIEVIELAKQLIEIRWWKYNNSINYKIGGIAKFSSDWLDFFLFNERLENKNFYQDNLNKKVVIKIKEINFTINKIIYFQKNNNKPLLYSLINKIFLDINSINISLSSLINYHLKIATEEKNKNDIMFNTSIVMLIFLIGFTFCLSILISYIIINHFKELHNSLEFKVLEKTKELRLLNNSLELRIKKEIENSRKKDQIMFQQAKLASLGEMLQNIAHQWRQPLGAIIMIIQSFQSKFFAGKLNEQFIESRVNDAMILSKNMSTTLEDFQTFFNPHKIIKNFNIKDVIEKAIQLTKYQLEKENINIKVKLKSDIKILNYKNELTHIILNIINNSKDAFINKNIESKEILVIIKETKTFVIINIIDNGGGINNDIITKVFEPYFTTKHQSIGTGIGLYMSKQILEKHMQGRITCKNIKYKMNSKRNTLDKCAMFILEIPKLNNRNINHE